MSELDWLDEPDTVEAVARELQTLPGWNRTFRLDNEARDVACIVIGTIKRLAAERGRPNDALSTEQGGL